MIGDQFADGAGEIHEAGGIKFYDGVEMDGSNHPSVADYPQVAYCADPRWLPERDLSQGVATIEGNPAELPFAQPRSFARPR